MGADAQADGGPGTSGSNDAGPRAHDAGSGPGDRDASVADARPRDGAGGGGIPGDGGAGATDSGASSCPSSPCTLYTGKGVGFPLGIAVDSTRIYIAENQAGAILALPIGGGAASTLASDPSRPMRVAVDAAAVYWTSQGGSVNSVPLAGGPVTTIFASAGTASGLALDASRVYWTLAGQGGSVLSAPLAGGAPTTIATSQDDPLYVAVTPHAAYWIDADIYDGPDGGCLMTAPLEGGSPAALSPWQNLAGRAVAVDTKSVYWAQAGSIYSRPLDGGSTVTLASGVDLVDMAVDGSHVYWGDRAANAIMKVSVAGGAPTEVAKSFQLPMYLTLDATTVYWTDFADLVMSAPK